MIVGGAVGGGGAGEAASVPKEDEKKKKERLITYRHHISLRFLGELNMFTAAASSSAGKWRTAFLSLRDEISTTPQPPVPRLLQDLIFSHSDPLLSAVSLLPPHELTSDCLFLLDLVSKADGPDWIPVSLHTCQLVRPRLSSSVVLLLSLLDSI